MEPFCYLRCRSLKNKGKIICSSFHDSTEIILYLFFLPPIICSMFFLDYEIFLNVQLNYFNFQAKILQEKNFNKLVLFFIPRPSLQRYLLQPYVSDTVHFNSFLDYALHFFHLWKPFQLWNIVTRKILISLHRRKNHLELAETGGRWRRKLTVSVILIYCRSQQFSDRNQMWLGNVE